MTDPKMKTIRVSWENSSAIGVHGEELIEVPIDATEDQIAEMAEDTMWNCSGFSWGYQEVEDD